ncbi:ATP-binding protein [Nonomuraea sp. NBC_00507]|uniref:ATP-binding protein n=1 Tax=Nonomuraea sp. NBC_00507 TaxID=2976002 RepID=UPI002E19088A
MRCLPASLTSLEEVARYVRTLADSAGLPAHDAHRLRLAADELVTNIVLHGYGDREGSLTLEGGVDKEGVWLRIQDEGKPFDPRAGFQPPENGVPPSERRIGGLGIFLALSSLDDFSYELTAGRNTSTLVVRSGTDEKT